MDQFFSRKEKNSESYPHLPDQDNIPSHIAIIMDGNGRWAKSRGLPRSSGHREGMKTITEIVEKSGEIGVDYLTLYAFSTENWKRPKTEVEFIMKLPERFLHKELPRLQKNNVQVKTIGDPSVLPEHTRRAVEKAVEKTAGNTGLILNFALNYGGRQELVEVVRQLGQEVQNGVLQPGDITEDMFSGRLLTRDIPDPDLLIRTSGEIRLSNFMLWQLAYSEFWFTDVLWPDFTESDLMEAVQRYQQRKRRYGGV